MKRVIFFLSLFFSACSSRPFFSMDQTESFLLRSHPDSVFHALKTLSVINADDSLARYTYDYYERHGDCRQRMISSYYLAAIEAQYNNTTEAILLFKEAETIASEIEDFGFLGMARQNLADLYSTNHLSEESFRYYKGAVESFSMFGDTVSADINRINIADYYCRQDLFPEALSIIDSLLAEPRNNKVVENALHVKGNICFAQGKWHEADSLFSQCQEYSISIIGKRCLALERMGDSFTADSLLKLAERSCYSAIDSAIYLSSARELNIIRNDYEKALAISDALLAAQIKHGAIVLKRSIPHARRAYWKDYNLVQGLHEHAAYLYLALFVLLLIVSNLLCFWVMNKSRVALILEKEVVSSLQADIHRLQKDHLTSESIVNALLQDKINRIQKLSGAFFKWTDEAVLLREEHHGKVMKEELISDFRKELRSFRDGPNLIREIEKALDQSRGGIMQSFRQAVSQSPDISFNEVDFELITLFFANFSSKSISYLLDMSDDAVRKRKSRYKRMFYKHGDNFLPFLEALE